jgi:hypothetical protein
MVTFGDGIALLTTPSRMEHVGDYRLINVLDEFVLIARFFC